MRGPMNLGLPNMIVEQNLKPGIFPTSGQEKAFQREGYTTLELFDQDTLQKLKALYKQEFRRPIEGEAMHGYMVALDHPDEKRVRRISEEILALVAPFLDKKFKNYQCVVASFLVKEPNEKNFTAPHQDWTFVDEKQYYSVTLWAPLTDVHVGNGALGVLTGSHLWYDQIRPSPVPPYRPPYAHLMGDMFPYLSIRDLPAGSAIAFDHRTVHGSPPNRSGVERVVVGLVLTHKEAMLRHYYLLPNVKEPTIEGLGIDRDFFYRYGNLKLKALHEKGLKPEGYTSFDTQAFAPQQWKKSSFLWEVEQRERQASSFLKDMWNKAFVHAEEVSSNGQVGGSSNASSMSSSASFWQTYTLRNICSEIKYRLTRRQRQQKVQEVSQLYDIHFESFQATYGEVIQSFRTKDITGMLEHIWDKIDVRAQDRVLDAGCGVGGPALHFADKEDFQLDAITVSQRQYEHFSQTLDKRNPRAQIRLKKGDFHDLCSLYGSQVFDRVYFLESFGHSPDKPRLLREVWSVLKPGGKLYIKDLFRRLTKDCRVQKVIDKEIDNINDFYAYDVSHLGEVLMEARKEGFILRNLQTIDIPIEDFENIQTAPAFEKLTGLNPPDPEVPYIFPLDFFELVLYKPLHHHSQRSSQYFLQKEHQERVYAT